MKEKREKKLSEGVARERENFSEWKFRFEWKAQSYVGESEMAWMKNRPKAKGRISQYMFPAYSLLSFSHFPYISFFFIFHWWKYGTNWWMNFFSCAYLSFSLSLFFFLSWMNFSYSFLIRLLKWIEANFSFML